MTSTMKGKSREKRGQRRRRRRRCYPTHQRRHEANQVLRLSLKRESVTWRGKEEEEEEEEEEEIEIEKNFRKV